MKKLTYSSMATARLRANKKSYVSLVLGIFLSIFLVSTLVLSVYGIYQAQLQKRYDKVGYLDMVVLDNNVLTDESMLALGDFDRLGHAYVSGRVTGKNAYLGYYDEMGASLLNLSAVEGRMPEAPGEIAIEASAMDVLEVQWSLGDTVNLSITPVDGIEETRQFTVVGFLPERSVYLEKSDHDGLKQFPAIVTCPQEPAFGTGRIALHYLMGLKENASLSSAITHFWSKYLQEGLGSAMYGLSISGEQTQFYNPGDLVLVERDMMSLIRMACILAAALILSCGIGISGAMEGVLSKRREEIGVLRALGATRRQIRQMFGRENLIMAAIVSPLSILISMDAVWVLSLLMPESLQFAVNLWLIVPIALFSVIVILISGYLPLVRASKLMPMSVIRDTAMLRRGKGVKSKKEFSVPKLISGRQIRFNPTRQIGATLLVGLMLLCAGQLSGAMLSYIDYTATDHPGFLIQRFDSYDRGYVQNYDSNSMTSQSLDQLEMLENVESIRTDREMPVLVQMEDVPRYAMLDGLLNQFGMLDDAGLQEALSYMSGDTSFYELTQENARREYQQLLRDYGFSNQAFQTVIITMEMDSDDVDMLNQKLSEGSIDVDAINAGNEVLVFAPNVWVKVEDGRNYQWTSEKAVKQNPIAKDAQLAAWNDCFYAGQNLPLTQLYSIDADDTVYRQDANVQVGGVVSELVMEDSYLLNTTAIITTEEGLINMGLRPEDLREVAVYLDGEISQEEEERLERQITAISRRAAGYSVTNQVAEFREREDQNRQQILMDLSIFMVFFAVAVGMIVSSVTRQLHSEGRTIGMLRAVGANEKTILGCYSGQLNAAVLGGLGITAVLLILYVGIYFADAIRYGWHSWYSSLTVQISIVVVIDFVMAAACWAVSRYMLRLRIRDTLRKSIIDNIREL